MLFNIMTISRISTFSNMTKQVFIQEKSTEIVHKWHTFLREKK